MKAKKSKHYVNFRQIKDEVPIRQVLEHYGLFSNMKGKYGQLHGSCPVHVGEDNRQFTINLDKNSWHCFGCKVGGDIFEFVSAMEDCSISNAGLKIANWFDIAGMNHAHSSNM